MQLDPQARLQRKDNMAHLEHKCLQGDRWDIVALKYYNDGRRTQELYKANPEHLGKHVFLGGETLIVPILETLTTDWDVPAWKK